MKKPLFHKILKGESEKDFFKILCNVVGNPSKKAWPEGYEKAQELGFGKYFKK